MAGMRTLESTVPMSETGSRVMVSGASMTWRQSAFSMIIGALTMVLIIHPLLELIHLLRTNVHREPSPLHLVQEAIQAAFAGRMLDMTLVLAAIGSVAGLIAVISWRLLRKSHSYSEFPENEDSLKALIQTGENDELEFKSSMRWDWKQEKVNKALESVIAKTLCGMMNHRGGVLLIGVDDEGRIVGIERDWDTLRRSDEDGFQQRLITLATTHLGGRHARGIQTRFLSCDDRTVAIVRIESRPKPVFCLDGNVHRYFVRAGNLTHELDAQEAMAHIAEQKER